MKVKKILLIITLVLIIIGSIVLSVSVNRKEDNSNKVKITASNFASYDFLRAIIGDNQNIELKFLIGPGKDAHGYDPTAQDLITIQNSDLFIYVGGEMESWSQKVLETLNTDNTKIICIANDVETIEEKEVDGAEEHEHEEHEDEENEHNHEEGAYDEHIWTSPKNAIVMINVLEKTMEKIDANNKEKYKANAEKYISEVKDVDNQIQEIVNNRKRDWLIFGDKMPMQYFIDYYKLNVSAAFNGCSTETEPSSKTIAYLVNTAKSKKIPVILYIELNNGKVAQTIADEVGNGCQAIQIQTLHNVAKSDFDNGETWVSLMKRNLDVLKEALQ